MGSNSPHPFHPRRLLGLLIIAAIAGSAEAAQQVELPAFQQESLLNGLDILLLDSQDAKSRFVLMIRNGAAFDPAEKWGVTTLMTRMMMRSTQGRNQEQIEFELNRHNARLAVRVGYDAMYFEGAAPIGRIPDVLALLSDIVIRPEFGEELFQQVRQEVVEERRRELSNPQVATQELLHAEIFGPNPYGHPIKGTIESLNRLLLNDIRIQYRRIFMPNQAQLALYFSGDRERLFRQMSRSWGGWVRGDALPFTFRRAPELRKPKIVVIDDASADALMHWGRLGVARNDPEFHTYKVIEQYLMLSLPQWAKDVGSKNQIQGLFQVEGHRMPGHVQLGLRCSPSDCRAYLKRLQAVMRDLGQGRIDAEQLAEAKNLVIQDFQGDLQEPQSRLRTLLEMKLYEIGAGYITTYGLRVNRVSAERVKRLAAARLPVDDFVLVVSGPGEELRSKLSDFGPTEIRSLAALSSQGHQ